jgi:hypothetical protein
MFLIITFAHQKEDGSMLSDLERKVLRIIENYTITKGKPPTYRQLSRFTGRSQSEIRSIVLHLKQTGTLAMGGRDGAGRPRVRAEKQSMEDIQSFIWHEMH